MPVSKHYSGHGEEVMANMMKEYGAKKGKQVFYATEMKRKKGLKEHTAAMVGKGHLRMK